MRILVAESVPNKAHLILAKWENEGLFDRFLVATQNVDGLHGLAGNNSLTELHGNIWEFARPKKVDYAEDERFSEEIFSKIPMLRRLNTKDDPPYLKTNWSPVSLPQFCRHQGVGAKVVPEPGEVLGLQSMIRVFLSIGTHRFLYRSTMSLPRDQNAQ